MHKALPALLLLPMFLAQASCRLPPPESGPGKAIRCATEAVERNWPAATPCVNTCLTGEGGVVGCLTGCIDPAIGITRDVIACVVRRSESEFAAQAKANPDDVRSMRATERAREYLQTVTFED